MTAHIERLTAAVAVFRDLGWDDANAADAATLPLGDSAQRATALAGLRSGEWDRQGLRPDGRYGPVDLVGVDRRMLTLFALRQGVTVRRFVDLLRNEDSDVLEPLMIERGEKFVVDVIAALSRADNRWAGTHLAVFASDHVVTLVQATGMPLPRSVEYLTDFFAHAAERLQPGADSFTEYVGGPLARGRDGAVAAEVLQPRFTEHAHLAVELGMPATGSLLPALTGAVSAGWLTRDDVLNLAFTGLENARRPGDRKVWAGYITGALAASDAEIGARVDALAALLATGEAALVDAFAPSLIAQAGIESLGDVALAALTVTTAKSRRTVLGALAQRTRPDADTAETVAAVISPWTTGRDRALAKAAQGLVDVWSLDAIETLDDEEPTYLWRRTPDVWDAPALVLDAPSPEAFRLALAALDERVRHDLEGEIFLAQLNALAAIDADAARVEFASLPSGFEFNLARLWATGSEGRERWAGSGRVLDRRNEAIAREPGRVPVILSTPSRVDMSVSGADLAARLELYAAGGYVAAEADLLAAVVRLDHASVSTDERERMRRADVAVVHFDGTEAAYRAGEFAAGHVGDPVIEPGWLARGKENKYRRQRFTTPASLSRSRQKLAESATHRPDEDAVTLHPFWGDALHATGFYEGATRDAWVWRQVARRSVPLSPGLAVNILGVQRDSGKSGGAQRADALHDAWERGLLRPGVADASLLDWWYEPDRLGALAESLLTAAREYGMAAVVWPLLDDFLVIAGGGSRMMSGAAELAEAMRVLAPVATAAVADGLADRAVLAVPGLRAVAARTGSSKAVVAARDAVALIGPAETTEKPQATGLTDAEFAAAWNADVADPEVIDDGVIVQTIMASGPNERLFVLFTLPDEPGVVYRIDHGGHFGDMEYQRTTSALRLPSTADVAAEVALADQEHRRMRWDVEAGLLIAEKFARKHDERELSQSLVVMMLALASRADYRGESAAQATWDLIGAGDMGSSRVASAVSSLQGQPGVNIARLATRMLAYPGMLAVVWPVFPAAIEHAASIEGNPPRATLRVLDVALEHAPVLREAARRGLIETEWTGLDVLAERPGKAAAQVKARALRAALGV